MTRTQWMTEGEPSDEEIRGEILRILILRGQGATICPTEVARSLFRPWREKMDRVRDVIAQMAVDRQIEVLQKERVVDIESTVGPVRLQLLSHQ